MNRKWADRMVSAISVVGTVVSLVQTVISSSIQDPVSILLSGTVFGMFIMIIVVFYIQKKRFVDLYAVCSSMAVNNRLQSLREIIFIQHRELRKKNNVYKIEEASFKYGIMPNQALPNSYEECYDIRYGMEFQLIQPLMFTRTAKNRTFRFYMITLEATPQDIRTALKAGTKVRQVNCIIKDVTTRGESGSRVRNYAGLYELIIVIPPDLGRSKQIEVNVSYLIHGQIKKKQGKHSFTIVPQNYGRTIKRIRVELQTSQVQIANPELQRYGIEGEFEVPELFVPKESGDNGMQGEQEFYTEIKPQMSAVYSIQFDLPK